MILYIANRGEIARRIIRTAKRLKIKTVVGYADQDKDLPFVREADVAIPLQGEEALDTYLHTQKVLSAAVQAKATHLHPGYGFLSENPQFVDLVQMEGIEFVGPSSESMRKLGDKMGAREFLKPMGVPLLPGYDGKNQNEDHLLQEAQALGFPLLIKPSAGGGGKGMQIVDSASDFLDKLRSAKRIAKSAFADDRVFFERYIRKARHIEVQILGDKHGNIFSLGERECSLQRRHQKMLEEAPCAFLPEKLRALILSKSREIAQAAKYYSLGTVEWIWDGADEIYFLEVNARLQVEHPVTEMTFGVDLVELQVRVAQGESLKDYEFKARGHAIEARLQAEDPSQNFIPSGGKIHKLRLPENIRIDFGFREKNTVPLQFDSLIGKIIAYGENREEARLKLIQALETLVVFGPTTNRAYLIQLLKHGDVIRGDLWTGLIAQIPYAFDLQSAIEFLRNAGGEGLADVEDLDLYSPWGELKTQSRAIDFDDFGDSRYFQTTFADWSVDRPKSKMGLGEMHSHELDASEVRSPMPAKIIRVNCSRGESVKKSSVLVVLEAMKMEHQLKAPKDGKIEAVLVKEGDRVAVDQLLVKLEIES